ncbi:related to phenylacetyl- ligase [Lecanosticta acicola]|uniref:Related to phenylacetyl- ligase n=1 Tax=Lecanosticta acicola TaxID=111012 RepID=A0AAI8Z2L7_9PEZI|nr:related to phenylacetyl- ligase [Lecanosticta acicola]
MVLWKADHPIIDIPTNVTTYQWAFESEEHSPVIRSPRNHGFYENASTKERLAFSHVKDLATHLHTALAKDHGFQPGDTISIFAGNSVWYPVTLWACSRGGGKINGASPDYGVEEIVHALKTAGTKFVFTTEAGLERVQEAVERVGMGREMVFLLEGEGNGEVLSIKRLVERGRKYPPEKSWRIPPGKNNKEVCGYLNFSSGTTGLPKAVELSHHNIIAQCHQLRAYQAFDPGENYRCLAITPVYHISGLVRYIHYPLLLNGNCYMLPAFNMDLFLTSIITHRIRELILVPPLVIRLVRDPVVEEYLPDLRRIVKRWSSGSAPTSPEIIHLLHQKFPQTGFRQGYGATESSGCITCHPPTHYDYKFAMTGGKLVPNTTAKILSLESTCATQPSREELGSNEIGEICARGPQIALGYRNNPPATAETFDRDGFLHTGDVGYFDARGLLHIVDRIKEMIKVRGQQVAPAELEDLLLSHPGVADCAVIPIPDAYSGEKPKAYVVLKAGVGVGRGRREEVLLGKEILRFVRERKVGYKRLKEVEFTDLIPKSATGKILRRALKGEEGRVGRQRGWLSGKGIVSNTSSSQRGLMELTDSSGSLL